MRNLGLGLGCCVLSFFKFLYVCLKLEGSSSVLF